jgi:opacity protein-like surface antigen
MLRKYHSPLFAFSTIALGLLPCIGHADTADGAAGFFVNGNFGQASLDKGLYNDTDTGYQVGVGYRWASNPRVAFGVEGGYVDLGTFGLDAHKLPAQAVSSLPKARISGWTAGANARVAFQPNWYVSARAGLFHANAKGAYLSTIGAGQYASGDDTSTEYYVGAGIGYNINDRLSIGFNIDYYKASVLLGPSLDSILSSVSAEYRFP